MVMGEFLILVGFHEKCQECGGDLFVNWNPDETYEGKCEKCGRWFRAVYDELQPAAPFPAKAAHELWDWIRNESPKLELRDLQRLPEPKHREPDA